MLTVTKKTKVGTGAKSILGNPFVGEDVVVRESFRQWLWLVCRGATTTDAAITIADEGGLEFNKKWVGPTREKLLQKLDALVAELSAGKELQLGEEAHSQIISNYLRWCLAGKPLKRSNT